MRTSESKFRHRRRHAGCVWFPNATAWLRFRTACAARLPLLLLLTLPAAVQAQFNYTTNNATITITRYTGSDGAVTIPSTINGLPVISIGDFAFYYCINLTNVTIPDSVTNIGFSAFYNCTSLDNVTIGNSVISIGSGAFSSCNSLTSVTIPNSVSGIASYTFYNCTSLTNITIGNSVTNIGFSAFSYCGSLSSVTIPNNVTSIGDYGFSYCGSLSSVTIGDSVTTIGERAFAGCTSLANVTIPNSVSSIRTYAFAGCASLTSVTIGNSVTSIGDSAFSSCISLTGVFFQGNAPSLGTLVFYQLYNAIIYYLPGTSGWGPTFGGRPTALWKPQIETCDASFGVRTNQFGFNISWASGRVIVVDACTNLANPIWFPVGNITLTGGTSYFSDPQWTNYPARFYRLRWP